ncbi:uncharacterized protein V1513DRAFT_436072 [Lipomyces chichibuensis]|uniref:uncharacterized protein n=1 Tax=Lipomyces chichibuensis TaxID=1546026 RepID=UPI003343F967
MNSRLQVDDPGVANIPYLVYEAVELVSNDIGHRYRLCHRQDELHSSNSTKDISRAKRWRMTRAAARLRCPIQNLLIDLHCRIAKYLCTTFNLIILQTFSVQ